MNDLENLFSDYVSQIHDGEGRIARGLADFEKYTSGNSVKAILKEMAGQNQKHLSALQQALDEVSQNAGERDCHAVQGIIDEALMTAKDFKGLSALDLTLLAFARKLAHYQIAAYGTLCSWSEELNLDKSAQDGLKECVRDAKEAESKFAEAAESFLLGDTSKVHEADSKSLFLRHLRGIFDGEHLLVNALAEVQFYAASPVLKLAVRMHRGETEKHVSRLESAFSKLNETADRKPCDGIEGIIDDAQVTVMEFLGNWALDAALIAAAQQAEHYEISAYSSALPWAKKLGYPQILPLLSENLADEIATDKKLSFAAEWLRNPKAKKGETPKHTPEEAEFLKMATHAG